MKYVHKKQKMGQFNLNLNPEFEKTLKHYMKAGGYKTKAKAIRAAVKEGMMNYKKQHQVRNFSDWIGWGLKIPLNQHPRFENEDQLWEKD